MTTQTPSTPSKSHPWIQVTMAALLAVMVGIVAYFAFSDDGAEISETTDTTSSATTSDYDTAVWPLVTMSVRYDTPEAAVQSFAVGFAGFTDPVISEFMLGDSRSGEFEIRPTTDGPVTVVFVRQLGPDDSWWILGSVSDNINVTEPPAFEPVTSPLVVAGEASSFEGTVQTELCCFLVRQGRGTYETSAFM